VCEIKLLYDIGEGVTILSSSKHRHINYN